MYTSRFPFLSILTLLYLLFSLRHVVFILFYCNLLFIAEADKDYETVRSKGEDEKVLGEEIHKSTDKQEREKATQKQVGEHEVFSPMTAKMKFNFIFFFNIIQQQNHSHISQLFRNLDKS